MADITLINLNMLFVRYSDSYDKELHLPLGTRHNEPQGFTLTGLAVLLSDSHKEFKRPIDTVQAISRSLLHAGDVAKVFSMC